MPFLNSIIGHYGEAEAMYLCVYRIYIFKGCNINKKIIITEYLELPEYLQSHQTKMNSPKKRQAFEHRISPFKKK